jgi:hypothetical protein
MKRRELLKAAALGAFAGQRVLGAAAGTQGQDVKAPPSDRIRIGMIGVGGFGFGFNLPDFVQNPDVEITAICDVYEPSLTRAVNLVEARRQGQGATGSQSARTVTRGSRKV